MSLVVLFLAMSVAVALPQNFWTYPSGSSFPFSGRYLGGELRENQYPSSPAVHGRRFFRIPEYQPYENFQANENEFSKHSTPVVLDCFINVSFINNDSTSILSLGWFSRRRSVRAAAENRFRSEISVPSAVESTVGTSAGYIHSYTVGLHPSCHRHGFLYNLW